MKNRRRLGIFGFLFFPTLLNVMNFVDRQLLASFGNWIKPDLQLSNTEFGILTGLAFFCFTQSAAFLWALLRINIIGRV